MNRPILLDRIVGVLYLLMGACGLLGTVMSVACVGLIASTNPEAAAQMQQVSTPDKALGGITSALALVVGIGVFMGARWGFLLGVISAGIGLLNGARQLIFPAEFPTAPAEQAQTQSAMAVALPLFGMVITLIFGAYFLWRLMTPSTPEAPPPPQSPYPGG